MTYEEAVDEILDMFKEAWEPTGYDVFYEQTRDQRNTTEDPWCSVWVRHSGGSQATLGGKGNRKFRRIGFVQVAIHTPSVFGLSSSYQLAKVVTDAYEGKSSANGKVWFRQVRINEAGRDGMFNILNVYADFEYDETK